MPSPIDATRGFAQRLPPQTRANHAIDIVWRTPEREGRRRSEAPSQPWDRARVRRSQVALLVDSARVGPCVRAYVRACVCVRVSALACARKSVPATVSSCGQHPSGAAAARVPTNVSRTTLPRSFLWSSASGQSAFVTCPGRSPCSKRVQEAYGELSHIKSRQTWARLPTCHSHVGMGHGGSSMAQSST